MIGQDDNQRSRMVSSEILKNGKAASGCKLQIQYDHIGLEFRNRLFGRGNIGDLTQDLKTFHLGEHSVQMIAHHV
jgi:hypothetical protein